MMHCNISELIDLRLDEDEFIQKLIELFERQLGLLPSMNDSQFLEQVGLLKEIKYLEKLYIHLQLVSIDELEYELKELLIVDLIDFKGAYDVYKKALYGFCTVKDYEFSDFYSYDKEQFIGLLINECKKL